MSTHRNTQLTFTALGTSAVNVPLEANLDINVGSRTEWGTTADGQVYGSVENSPRRILISGRGALPDELLVLDKQSVSHAVVHWGRSTFTVEPAVLQVLFNDRGQFAFTATQGE